MITLTQLLHFVITIGIIVGFAVPAFRTSFFNGVVYIISGFFIGSLIGSLPSRIEKWICFHKVKKMSTQELETALLAFDIDKVTPNYCVTELLARGECVRQYLPYLVELMSDESFMKRQFGYAAFLSVFPYSVVSQIEKYRPMDSAEVCRSKAKQLLTRFRCKGYKVTVNKIDTPKNEGEN